MTRREQKQKQRAAGLVARRGLQEADRTEYNRRIAERICAHPAFEGADVLLSYCAVRGEVDPLAIDRAARQLGKRVAYPLCGEQGCMRAACPDGEDALQPGRYGIPEPQEGAYTEIDPAQIDLVLVPCSAFDEAGGRVGMGGGYYDRFLPRCTRAAVIALAYEAQKVPAAAREAHDVPMDAVVSEEGIYTAAEKE